MPDTLITSDVFLGLAEQTLLNRLKIEADSRGTIAEQLEAYSEKQRTELNISVKYYTAILLIQSQLKELVRTSILDASAQYAIVPLEARIQEYHRIVDTYIPKPTDSEEHQAIGYAGTLQGRKDPVSYFSGYTTSTKGRRRYK